MNEFEPPPPQLLEKRLPPSVAVANSDMGASTVVVSSNDDTEIRMTVETLRRRQHEEQLEADDQRWAMTVANTTLMAAESQTHMHTPLYSEHLYPTPLNEAATRLQSTTLLPAGVYHNAIGFSAGPAHQLAPLAARTARQLIGERIEARHALEQRTLQASRDEVADERATIDAELDSRRRQRRHCDSGVDESSSSSSSSSSSKRRRHCIRRIEPAQLKHTYVDSRSGLRRTIDGGKLPAMPEAVFVGANGVDAARLAAYDEQREFIGALDLSIDELRAAGFIESRLGTTLFAPRDAFSSATPPRLHCSFRNCTRRPTSRTLCDTHKKQHWRIVRRFFKPSSSSSSSSNSSDSTQKNK